MKRIINKIMVGLLLLIAAKSYAQQQERPIKWVASVEQTKQDSATLVFTANIEKGWHIYSQFTPDGGPIATAITYPKTPKFVLAGKTSEPKPDETFDKDFGVKVLTLQGTPIFKQKIAVKEKKKFTIPVKIDYEACKDKCIFLDTSFVLTINPMIK